MPLYDEQRHQELRYLLDLFASQTDLRHPKVDEYWLKLNKLQALSQVQIDDIKYKGVINKLDESVTIRNRGELTIDISGWRISAGPKQEYCFPSDTYIKPYETIEIDTRGDNKYSFCSNVPIWNDKGDTAKLFDAENNLVSVLVYGSHARSSVAITTLNYDGKEFRTEADEFVEVFNISQQDVLISGWRLESKTNGKNFVFPDRTKLTPHQAIRIFTNKKDCTHDEFSFDSPTAIWNNQGGSCRLIDYLEREVSTYDYGSELSQK